MLESPGELKKKNPQNPLDAQASPQTHELSVAGNEHPGANIFRNFSGNANILRQVCEEEALLRL